VVSSRDALEAALAMRVDELCYGSMGTATAPLGLAGEVRRDADMDFYERADEIVLLGVTGWNLADQSALEAALQARPRPIHVANPDVASPQQNGFSAEPGYWAARAMIASETDVFWYGKPHHSAFAMAFDRLQTVTGRQFDPGRVAMVGDSLHTDIIGASAFGLQTILMTGHGLFRDGGAGSAIKNCGIYPDWMVVTP
jgi:ribonucleotide monophosphatase NagD (HAD superfamily)